MGDTIEQEGMTVYLDRLDFTLPVRYTEGPDADKDASDAEDE